jgi:hypothetical protein
MSDLLHGAEIREGYLVSGDATVMAFTRHESHGRNNFILIDVVLENGYRGPLIHT